MPTRISVVELAREAANRVAVWIEHASSREIVARGRNVAATKGRIAEPRERFGTRGIRVARTLERALGGGNIVDVELLVRVRD